MITRILQVYTWLNGFKRSCLVLNILLIFHLAFHKAGKPEEAIKVLKILIENAIDESRFDDSGYYHWILSRQYLDMAQVK